MVGIFLMTVTIYPIALPRFDVDISTKVCVLTSTRKYQVKRTQRHCGNQLLKSSQISKCSKYI